MRFSLESDPTLVWVRPDGRPPVTFFTGAQTERPIDYISNYAFRKSKGQYRLFFRQVVLFKEAVRLGMITGLVTYHF